MSHGNTKRRMARLVTEVMSPIVLLAVVVLIVAVDSAGVSRGMALGLVAFFFTGGFPYGLVLIGVRRGLFTDHHISRREQRPRIMAIALASAVAGLAILRWLDAPRALFTLLAAMVAGLVIAIGITSFWKISLHAAVAAGTVASLAVQVSPWWLLLVPLVGLTGWARVEIGDHTPVQVVVGAIVGAVIATGVLALVA